MRLTAEKANAQGRLLEFWRLDTNTRFRTDWVRWVDVDRGEICVFTIDPEYAQQVNVAADVVSKVIRAPIRLVEISRTRPSGLLVGEPLPEEFQEMRKGYEQCLAISGQFCEYPGCHDLAVWRVGDLQETLPILDDDGIAYMQHVMVRPHLYCHRESHYREPVRTSLRGVESLVATEFARPQW